MNTKLSKLFLAGFLVLMSYSSAAQKIQKVPNGQSLASGNWQEVMVNQDTAQQAAAKNDPVREWQDFGCKPSKSCRIRQLSKHHTTVAFLHAGLREFIDLYRDPHGKIHFDRGCQILSGDPINCPAKSPFREIYINGKGPTLLPEEDAQIFKDYYKPAFDRESAKNSTATTLSVSQNATKSK